MNAFFNWCAFSTRQVRVPIWCQQPRRGSANVLNLGVNFISWARQARRQISGDSDRTRKDDDTATTRRLTSPLQKRDPSREQEHLGSRPSQGGGRVRAGMAAARFGHRAADQAKADKRTGANGRASCDMPPRASRIPSHSISSSTGRAASMSAPLVSPVPGAT